MSYFIIIPARYSSTRLPGKPLLDIAGKPMIQYVYERAKSSSAEQVIVATDDQRILDAVEAFGGRAIMTNKDHPSGTDRLEEVVRKLKLDDEKIVVNLQGDEPLLSVNAIEQVATNLAVNSDCGMATLCERINDNNELVNTNVVKVVRDLANHALYFSRSTIPYPRDGEFEAKKGGWYRHMGIYAYRVNVLKQYVQWPPAPLERSEMLEQLRALYNNIRIHCDEGCESIPAGVDTQADLDRVRKILTQ